MYTTSIQILIELLKKIFEYSVYIYGAPDKIVYSNKRSNVNLLNNEIGLILEANVFFTLIETLYYFSESYCMSILTYLDSKSYFVLKSNWMCLNKFTIIKIQ